MLLEVDRRDRAGVDARFLPAIVIASDLNTGALRLAATEEAPLFGV